MAFPCLSTAASCPSQQELLEDGRPLVHVRLYMGTKLKRGKGKKKSADTAGCAAAVVNQRRPQRGALPRRTTPPPPWNTTPLNLELFFPFIFCRAHLDFSQHTERAWKVWPAAC